jgi:tRNA1Val (adenine37-N6)-methyltransferase
MANNYFQFKQFRIVQEKAAMKVGIDGVLLGAWASCHERCSHILDVGTGTGLIALMLAQRFYNAKVTAIEIDAQAAAEALFNVRQSPWNELITVQTISFQDYLESNEKFDLIVCNPPFFTNGTLAPDNARAQARHNSGLTLNELLSGASTLLKPQGRLSLILPAEQWTELERTSPPIGLFVNRICWVKPNPQKPVHRIMAELSAIKGDLQEETLLIEYEKHFDYTPEYRALTKDFYLKF